MRRAFLFILLLLFLPSASFAGPGALKWIEGSGYSPHSTKSGSSSLLREVERNSSKKSFLYEIANETNNLGKKAAKTAGTGSKLGVAGAVGKKLSKAGRLGLYGIAGMLVFDLGSDYLKDKWKDYPILREILCQTLGMCPVDGEQDKPFQGPDVPPVGTLVDLSGCGTVKIISIGNKGTQCWSPERLAEILNSTSCTTRYVPFAIDESYRCTNPEAKLTKYYTIKLQVVAPPEEPIFPDELTPELEETLSERILEELAKLNESAEQLEEELNNLVNRSPESVLWDPLEIDELKEALYEDEAEKLQQQKEELENQLNDDPNNQDLLDQLRQIEDAIRELDYQHNKERLEEEQKKQEEEKFDSIGHEEWEPYDPGPFDIPARFNSMLNTVKSTALFSFSHDFFESLPSGGSPIVTVQGGNIFGNHTIDLSDTMQAGLLAFRAVVMVIFGFLAIRAVIMKR